MSTSIRYKIIGLSFLLLGEYAFFSCISRITDKDSVRFLLQQGGNTFGSIRQSVHVILVFHIFGNPIHSLKEALADSLQMVLVTKWEQT